MMPNHGSAIQQRARNAVRAAIKSGALIRPIICTKCKIKPRPAIDGRSMIHAHHHKGYQKALDVEWLCARCHSRTDAKNHGESHPKNVLKKADIRHIMRLKEQGIGYRRAGHILGAPRESVRDVMRGNTWSWFTGYKQKIKQPKKRVR